MPAPIDRKPLIVLLGLALLVLVLFAAGVVGAGRRPAAETNPSWFGAPRGGQLEPDALVLVSGACSVSGSSLNLNGGCAFEVTPVQGGLPWSDAVRRAKLRVTGGVVIVAVRIQGRTMSTTLDPGEDVRLVFTRDGGPLTLGCVMVGGCTAVLLGDSGP
ncbi:hypothetical protein IPV09_08645 [Tessaracoccus sp. SD287]|uniref:hypothetical protein n=1 Tax=Tessaracoccus sp. SD287 TaxID=2782008 RepID=UPI001A956CEA|nr:hypothetical protein [Tessaracoccus sp. SD287]MBO1031403.1 hypothetical protein [Tessaracoccus sp. SD287]